jgi:hypothetical protein
MKTKYELNLNRKFASSCVRTADKTAMKMYASHRSVADEL